MLKQIWTRVSVALFKDPRRFDISNERKYPLVRRAPEGFSGGEWHWMLIGKAGCRRPVELDEAHKICLERAAELAGDGMKPAEILKTIAAEKMEKAAIAPSPSKLER